MVNDTSLGIVRHKISICREVTAPTRKNIGIERENDLGTIIVGVKLSNIDSAYRLSDSHSYRNNLINISPPNVNNS